MKKTILVTGANGFIGAKVVEQLCNSGKYNIVAVDLNNTNINHKACFLELNILEHANDENLSKILGNPNIIIHLAWRDGFIHNSKAHIEDLAQHMQLIQNFYSFEQLESLSVMGTMHEIGYYEGMISDTTPCNPTTLYGISKNALRQFAFSQPHNCSLKWLRAYYIFDNAGNGSSIFSKIIKAANEGKHVFPLTMGENKCDYISLEELSEQIVEASTQNEVDGIINVCSGEPLSLKNAVTYFVKNNNLDIEFDFGAFPDRPYDSHIIFGDNKKISFIMNSSFPLEKPQQS